MVWLDLGGLASIAPKDLVPAIEARRGVFSDRHQAKLRITEGGTGHNAPWSGGAEGLFRPNKIRGFLKQIDAGWEMVAPEDKMGFQRPETIPALAAIAEPLIAGRPRHLAFAHETPRVIVLPVTASAAKRVARILDSRRKL
jgi:hypothetical protein